MRIVVDIAVADIVALRILCSFLGGLALCVSNIAQADVFSLSSGLTNLETVTVGDPGNGPDTRYDPEGYGSVGHSYRIGK